MQAFYRDLLLDLATDYLPSILKQTKGGDAISNHINVLYAGIQILNTQE